MLFKLFVKIGNDMKVKQVEFDLIFMAYDDEPRGAGLASFPCKVAFAFKLGPCKEDAQMHG